MRACLVAALAVLGLLLMGAAPGPPPAPASGVDPALVPAPARDSLELISELTATRCPELPPLWVVAQVQAESGWDERLTSARPGGPAGLYQLTPQSWEAAGGQPWVSDPPPADADVTTAATHLRIAVPWVCANLRAVTAHLEATGKPTDPLDAMLVCHIAGCGRVTGSATGVPAAGEADCSERCAQVIGRYLEAVHGNLARFAGPAPGPVPTDRTPGASPGPGSSPRTGSSDPAAPDPPAEPGPWTGGATGCRRPDPTGQGCVTGATRHGLDATAAAFGGWSAGPVIRSAGCWDRHAWNPRSDHPRGRACDLFATRPGRFADGDELESGWRLADWLRTHADRLEVKYVIWQGRYWDPRVRDRDGWGRRYTGGGVYDVHDATGGHFDHVHVSFRE